MFTHLWFSMTDIYLLTGRWPQKRQETKHKVKSVILVLAVLNDNDQNI